MGEGRQRRWTTTTSTTNGRAIGDLFSSIGMTQQNFLWDEIRRRGWDEIRRPPVKDNGWTHKTTNQKHAAIMEDVRIGSAAIGEVKVRCLVTI